MKDVSAQEALDLMNSDPDYIYLDVRSVPEFEAGHPVRAMNIPLMHMVPGIGMSPNEDFPAVVQANLPTDAKLLVGCKTGMRSARATELLTQLGYSNVTNMRGGFAGLTDNSGRLVDPGWSTLNLPVCTECAQDARYEKLASKIKK